MKLTILLSQAQYSGGSPVEFFHRLVGPGQHRSSSAYMPARRPITEDVPMSKISPCLLFDGKAEEAATFYVSLLPDSRIEHVQRTVMDSPAGKKGSALMVAFLLAGQKFLALNGGMHVEYTHAVSFH